MKQYIGYAKDIHTLIKGNNKPLILGGYKINNNSFYIKAHSDGDLILHSLASSILGAMGESITIGELFPDTDQNTKNINSQLILNHVLSLLNDSNLKLLNIDITIITEQILLKDYLKNIQLSLSKLTDINHIGIKCTRFENINNFQIESICLVSLEEK